MKAFEYVTANSAGEAVSLLGDDHDSIKVIAGGMDLVTEFKEYLVETQKVVSIKDLDELHYIDTEGGAAKVGAAVTLTEILSDPGIKKNHTAFAESAASVGSTQIRNVGTLGGNLCQRPRCWYYRGEYYHCLKKGGAICFTLSGRNKYNAIFGGGPSYIVHPSDCATALVALNAIVNILGPDGARSMPLEDFFTLPTRNLRRENQLEPNEIVTGVEIPAHNCKSAYVKFREKDSYDWAVSAVAAALEMDGSACKKASIVLGGVAPKPWRAKGAEEALNGKELNAETIEAAAAAAVEGAEPMSENGYKVPLTRNLVKHTLMKLAG